ncbi:glycosyltransferase [Lachnoclostridium phocaeense]|uniref:glycosyltransferase n=1 Tax=Lachnoclostridium phocaeense TaxID=1871021 RepID=UPI00248DE70E|nr:glycosyltransferase [Lachnoclostridium phocaeense]
MRVEVLVSTMNQKNYDLLDKMNINSDAVVVNQCDCDNKLLIKKDLFNILWINTTERGLSRSRNMAINNAKGDICIIADDDEIFIDNYAEVVKSAFEREPQYSILRFCIEGIEKEFKRYPTRSYRIGFINSMKTSSVELAFKRTDIYMNNIKFDTLIGAGTKYPMGEENSFLIQCLKKRLRIKYIPRKIANLHIGNSSWFKNYDKNYFIGRGAAFTSMSRRYSFILIFQFAIRKYRLYKDKINIADAIRYMIEGSRKYKSDIKKKRNVKIFLQGDFRSVTGPAIANYDLKESLKACAKVKYSRQTNKFLRVIELIGKTLNTDIIILCGLSEANFITLYLAKKLNKPIYYYMHGCHKIEDVINNVQYNEVVISQEKRLLEKVNKIICVSDFFKEKICEIYPDYKEKIIVHYNCIDLSKFDYEIKKSKELTVLSTGGCIPRKANLLVCEAINKLIQEKRIKIKYIIVGPACGKKKEVEKYPFVTYYEFLPHKKILELMKTVNVYVQNSQFETFGLAVVEAVLQGASLLASKNIGALEIFNNVNEQDIINDPSDIFEISNKLWNCLQNSNSKRLYKGINYEKIDVNKTGEQLLEKLFV